MKKTSLLVLSLALVFISMSFAGVKVASAMSYTSLWNDYKTVVPDGWTASYDSEGTHYAEADFTSSDPNYRLEIRWYTRYATHRLPDGMLEMYSGPDDFTRQFGNRYGAGNVVEKAHEINIGGKKAERFAGRLPEAKVSTSTWDTSIKAVILGRQAMLGKMVEDSVAEKGGRQIWTVIAAPSGFYVFAYLAPEADFATYQNSYDQMMASFIELKDGPGGTLMPGVQAQSETPAQKLNRYLTLLGTRKDAATDLRKEIIGFAATMTPAPAIPDDAERAFIQAGVFMKDAKNADDYKSVIDKYNEALNKAPWWGNAYYNRAMAEEAAGYYDAAKADLELYIYTKPADAAQAKSKIYEIEAQEELQKKHEAEMEAKYGGGQGGGFGFDALYRYGAVVQDMSFDASGNEHTISLKVQTRKENGYLHNYLAIFDMTSHEDIFGQVFDMDWRGTKTFYLDDRGPYRDYMTLTVTSFGDNDATITIQPAGNASAVIQTTLVKLLRERASQAVYAGGTITIGGEDFYVLGQGGAKGALLYFPAKIKGILDSGSAQDLMPELVANVNYFSNGQTVNYTNTDLGEVNGMHYHLEFIDGIWQPKEGQGENN